MPGKIDQFGLTNDDFYLGAATAWREAAMADGWTGEPTYPSHEPIESAAKLTHPDGFTAQILTRTHAAGSRYKFSVSVHVWGPDGLTVEPPDVYEMTAIRMNARKCCFCAKPDCATTRVGFAGRACLACAPVEEAKLPRHYYD
jgi:hypothetical protein